MPDTVSNETLTKMNGTSGFSGGCYGIKCHFTDSERIAIIFAFSVVFVASFAGNFVVCLLITRTRRLRNCTNFSVLNLCIADLLITIFCIPMLTIDFYVVDEWLFGAFMCKMVTFLQTTAVDASVLVLATISVEKFVVVCFPFQSRVYRRWFRYIVVSMWLVAIADASHTTIFKKIKVIFGHPKCIMEYPQTHSYKQSYLMGHAVLLFFLPLLLMTILHCITVFVIQKKISTKSGSSTNSQTVHIIRVNVRKLHRKRKAVAILVLIVLLFAVCWGPYLSLAIWDAYFPPTPANAVEYYLLLNKIYVVFVWMVFFNSALHPVIYCFLGREYRTAARNSFKRKSNTSTTRTTRHRQQPAIPLKRYNYTKA